MGLAKQTCILSNLPQVTMHWWPFHSGTQLLLPNVPHFLSPEEYKQKGYLKSGIGKCISNEWQSIIMNREEPVAQLEGAHCPYHEVASLSRLTIWKKKMYNSASSGVKIHIILGMHSNLNPSVVHHNIGPCFIDQERWYDNNQIRSAGHAILPRICIFFVECW